MEIMEIMEIVIFLHHQFFTAYMVSQVMLPKSSANYLVPRRFSQKGFEVSIFGHRSCPFSRNFLTLVQIRIDKITKLMYVIIGKKKSIMVTKSMHRKKVSFCDEIF